MPFQFCPNFVLFWILNWGQGFVMATTTHCHYCPSSNSVTAFEVFSRPLSIWKTHLQPSLNILADVWRCCFNIFTLCNCLSTSILWSAPVPPAEKHPHIMMLPGWHHEYHPNWEGWGILSSWDDILYILYRYSCKFKKAKFF